MGISHVNDRDWPVADWRLQSNESSLAAIGQQSSHDLVRLPMNNPISNLRYIGVELRLSAQMQR